MEEDEFDLLITEIGEEEEIEISYEQYMEEMEQGVEEDEDYHSPCPDAFRELDFNDD